jgi:hypothetical protein
MLLCRYIGGFLLFSASAAATSIAGCGGGATDDLPRQAVSGKVTMDGKPLDGARITFQPAGETGTPAGGEINGGEYSIPKEDGPPPDTYAVRITTKNTTSTTDPNAMPGDPPPVPKEKIPPKYNTKSALNATVKKEGPNTFDFELKSK